MTTYWLSPVFNGEQFFDNNGVVLANGKIFAYTAGSFSVQQTIFCEQVLPNSTQPNFKSVFSSFS